MEIHTSRNKGFKKGIKGHPMPTEIKYRTMCCSITDSGLWLSLKEPMALDTGKIPRAGRCVSSYFVK